MKKIIGKTIDRALGRLISFLELHIQILDKKISTNERNNIRGELLRISPQERETRAIWDMFNNPMVYFRLCGNNLDWFAIGIPFFLVDQSIQGDLDIIAKLGPRPDGTPHYHTYEVKTWTIDRKNTPRSIKDGKKKKSLLKQLKKQQAFGTTEHTLIDITVMETGYSLTQENEYPDRVVGSWKEKATLCHSIGVGYWLFGIEDHPLMTRQQGMMDHKFKKLNIAIDIPAGAKFEELVAMLDKYARANLFPHKEGKGFGIITYCKKCKDLTTVHRGGPLECVTCQEKLLFS